MNMKRDMDLIRGILLKIEDEDKGGGQWVACHIDGYDNSTVIHHLFLLFNEGYIEGNDLSSLAGRDFGPRQLTWKGHDFLDAIRDPENWKKTKEGALAAGGWTFDILRDLAKGLIKKKIEDTTGVKL